VEAVPPSRAYTLRKFLRKHKSGSTVALVLTITALALIGTGIFSYAKIVAKNRLIEQEVRRATEAQKASELSEGASLDLQGRALMASGQWRKAGPPLEESYRLLVKDAGNLGEILADRGAFCARSGLFRQAADDYGRAIDLNPQDMNL